MTALEIIGATVLVTVTLFVMWVLWIAVTAFVPTFIKTFRAKWKEIDWGKKK
jgi:uncharacterized membrane protein (DUF485 family)